MACTARNFVTRSVIGPENRGASGLLTRFGPDSDFGTDAWDTTEPVMPLDILVQARLFDEASAP